LQKGGQSGRASPHIYLHGEFVGKMIFHAIGKRLEETRTYEIDNTMYLKKAMRIYIVLGLIWFIEGHKGFIC
jgi:hypothetical protein